MAYHYKESGLDNVFLENGFKIHRTKYGKGVSIEDTEGLHRALGRWLIELPKPLIGAELRFLRLEMDLSQNQLAQIIGSAEQNVRRWEKPRNRAIPGLADRLVRALYSEYSGGDGSLRRMVDRLAELDQVDRATAHFRETKRGWQVSASADC
jgi:DNA-binding transcriptional regulator YiaG